MVRSFSTESGKVRDRELERLRDLRTPALLYIATAVIERLQWRSHVDLQDLVEMLQDYQEYVDPPRDANQ